MSKNTLNCMSAVKRGPDGKRPQHDKDISDTHEDLKKCLSNAGDSNVDIALAFDRSASMSAIEKEAKDALDKFINSIKKESKTTTGNIRFTLITFDTEATLVYGGRDIDSLPEKVDENLTRPRGSTRLCDTALEMLEAQEMRCDENWKRVIVILTDGADNASRKTCVDLHEKITEAEKNDTTCIFLASNQDAIHSGAMYGFTPQHAITFSQGGTDQALGAVSGGIMNVMHTQSSEASPHFEFSQLQREVSSGVSQDGSYSPPLQQNMVLPPVSYDVSGVSPLLKPALTGCPPPTPLKLTRRLSKIGTE